MVGQPCLDSLPKRFHWSSRLVATINHALFEERKPFVICQHARSLELVASNVGRIFFAGFSQRIKATRNKAFDDRWTDYYIICTHTSINGICFTKRFVYVFLQQG
jgi:hypothetical protein